MPCSIEKQKRTARPEDGSCGRVRGSTHPRRRSGQVLADAFGHLGHDFRSLVVAALDALARLGHPVGPDLGHVLGYLEGARNTRGRLGLAADENMSEAVALLSQHGVLEYLHFNDNYRSWDDDMIAASVHVVEYLELVYWLKRVGYEGWLTLDIYPYREEKVPAARESFAWLKTLFQCVERKGLDAIYSVIERGEGTEATKLVRELLTNMS